MYIYTATGDILEMAGGRKQIYQCIVGRKGGNVDRRWKRGNVVDVIEYPKKIKLLDNTHT